MEQIPATKPYFLSKKTLADHKKSPRIILILGMHRSGSSLLTQLISSLGIHLGQEIMKADKFNPDGYWENLRVVDLHNRMLEEQGNQWYAPAHPIDTTRLLKKYGEEALLIVSEMDRQGLDWGWKDPRMPLFLDFWLEILKGRDIRLLITNRSPSAIAASLLQRDAIPVAVALYLWEMTTRMILSRINSTDDHLIVNYDALMKAPEIEIPGLIRFVLGDIHPAEMDAKKAHLLKLLKQELNHGSTVKAYPLSTPQQFLQESCLSGMPIRDMAFHEAEMDKLRDHFRLLQAVNFIPEKIIVAQLFYRETDAAFNEACSMTIHGLQQPIVFRFEKALRILQLRFDPVNDHAVLKILEMRFFKTGNEVETTFSTAANAFADEDGTLYFHDDDPQIIITFDEGNLPEMDEVEIRYELVAKGIQALEISRAYTVKKVSASDAMIRRQEDEMHNLIFQQEQLLERLRLAEEDNRLHVLGKSTLQIRSDESQKEIASLKAAISDLMETIQRQDEQLRLHAEAIEHLKNSRSYRIGHTLLSPLRLFRK